MPRGQDVVARAALCLPCSVQTAFVFLQVGRGPTEFPRFGLGGSTSVASDLSAVGDLLVAIVHHPMSLYYDAATVLSSTELRGSLKSRVYGNDRSLKSKPAHLYALISECAKYDFFLKEVIDNAGILKHEPKVWRTLSPCCKGSAD